MIGVPHGLSALENTGCWVVIERGRCGVQVASTFLSGLQNAAQSCINGLPSINGDAASTVVTDQYNKCCPVIKAVSDLSPQCLLVPHLISLPVVASP